MDLRAIERRVSDLEQKIGAPDLTTSEQGNRQNFIESLISVNNKLSTTLKSGEKIKESLKQLKDLPDFLDPNFADDMVISREAKMKVIELLWPTIEDRIEQLEKLQNLLPVLDSEHIKNAPSLSASLAPVGSKQLDQIENIRGHTKDVSELIKLYNELIISMNKQFVYWDKRLNEYESKHQMF